jgi:CRISPR-associated Csx2 family protein|uniref:CRISPR-associated protein DxTHG motif n=1 Tax=Leptospirillum ferrodiazotrophum TaxID=412449 RepID=C6HZN8_9BACT|nr:MAG: CRISPR-associated protein DxTHG motif [Leptospirillum ferrodiazotrophum]
MEKIIKVLLTFLGSANKNRVPDKKEPFQQNSAYKKTVYSFQGKTMETPYVGVALSDFIRPDRTIVLGSSSSMWDDLLEYFKNAGEEEVRLELIESREKESVSDALLARIAPLLAGPFQNPPILRVVPHDASPKAQVEILHIMQQAVAKAAEEAGAEKVQLHIDITHSFRYYPLLAQQGAFLLEYSASPCVILKGLYYGAFEMPREKESPTPILLLDGVMKIQEWIDALARFDSNGDYAVFSSLLKNANIQQVNLLEEAAYFERMFNAQDSSARLRSFMPCLDVPLVDRILPLFLPELRRRCGWAQREHLHEKQRDLGDFYQRVGDYARAVIFFYESAISWECKKKGENPLDFIDRDSAKERLNASGEGKFLMMGQLRNAIAHGTPPNRSDAKTIMKDREALKRTLREFRQSFLSL